jgi:hypothetical protein
MAIARCIIGEKAADLQMLVINLRPSRTLGLIVPPTLLARADEVKECSGMSAHGSERRITLRWMTVAFGAERTSMVFG